MKWTTSQIVPCVLLSAVSAQQDSSPVSTPPAPTISVNGPVGHVGPITALRLESDRVLALSQAGLFAHAPTQDGQLDTGERLWTDDTMRGTDFASLGDAGYVVVGGVPGESGLICWLDAAAQPVATRIVAEDLLTSVVAAPAVPAPHVEPTPQAVVVGSTDGRVLWVSGPEGRIETLVTHEGPCSEVAVSGLGGRIFSCGRDGVIHRIRWQITADGQPAPPTAVDAVTDHTAAIDALAITFTGGNIASGARDGRVRFHQKGGYLQGTTPPLGSAVVCLAPVVTPRPGSAAGPGLSWAVGLADGRLLLVSPIPGREPALVAKQSVPVHAIGVPSVRGRSLDVPRRALPSLTPAWLPRVAASR